ncbi:MAG: hypothetical protein AAGK02_02655 [Pseudomonadota bacterium]
MNNLSTRMAKLERANGSGLRPITTMSVSFFRPGLEGPVNGGPGIITVMGGEQFCRRNYQSADEFYAAVDECHRRVHGRPYPMEDKQ